MIFLLSLEKKEASANAPPRLRNDSFFASCPCRIWAANVDPYSTRAYEPDPVVLDSIKKSCNKKLQYLISKSAILSDINDVIVCI